MMRVGAWKLEGCSMFWELHKYTKKWVGEINDGTVRFIPLVVVRSKTLARLELHRSFNFIY